MALQQNDKYIGLPPPVPILPRDVMDIETPKCPYFIGNLQEFPGRDIESPINQPSGFCNKAQFDGTSSLKQIMSRGNIVYKRFIDTQSEYFNSNTVEYSRVSRRRVSRKSIDAQSNLKFESKFQSGNLAMASLIQSDEYYLICQNDTNSYGHTQWFFFRIENQQATQDVTFKILNFIKQDSLFNFGMKPLVYSVQQFQQQGIGWHRSGDNISYYSNNIKREHLSIWKSYYTLEFTYRFIHPNDTVFFAYSYPYTYTQLQKYLNGLEKSHTIQQFMHRKTLCRSLYDNKCEQLIITNRNTNNSRKKAVVFTSRVHPGETVGSYAMEGLIDFLTGFTNEAEYLRNNFVFRIVPMLNPDGVICGNYRCNISGHDLNRRWKRPNQNNQPIIFTLKKALLKLRKVFDIVLICDFHGHSRKLNSFMYGCNIEDDPITCREFPYIFSKISPSFKFEDCRFGQHPSKESTLRISLFRQLQVNNVFTCETSLAGWENNETKMHYTIHTLKMLGRDIAIALIANHNFQNVPLQLKLFEKYPTRKAITQEIDQQLIDSTIEQDSGSDSEPSEDNLTVKRRSKSQVKQRKVIFRGKRSINSSFNQRQTPQKLNDSSTIKEPTKPPKKQIIRRKVVGVKTYYNLKGKMVHDQTCQTPITFYPKIAQIRAQIGQRFRNRSPVLPRENFRQDIQDFKPKTASNSMQKLILDKEFNSSIRIKRFNSNYKHQKMEPISPVIRVQVFARSHSYKSKDNYNTFNQHTNFQYETENQLQQDLQKVMTLYKSQYTFQQIEQAQKVDRQQRRQDSLSKKLQEIIQTMPKVPRINHIQSFNKPQRSCSVTHAKLVNKKPLQQAVQTARQRYRKAQIKPRLPSPLQITQFRKLRQPQETPMYQTQEDLTRILFNGQNIPAIRFYHSKLGNYYLPDQESAQQTGKALLRCRRLLAPPVIEEIKNKSDLSYYPQVYQPARSLTPPAHRV